MSVGLWEFVGRAADVSGLVVFLCLSLGVWRTMLQYRRIAWHLVAGIAVWQSEQQQLEARTDTLQQVLGRLEDVGKDEIDDIDGMLDKESDLLHARWNDIETEIVDNSHNIWFRILMNSRMRKYRKFMEAFYGNSEVNP